MTTATAWYVIPSTNVWARWFNMLHWPYTLWHLSYSVIGAALATELNWALLGWTVLAFFLGMGVAAHALDLLQGDPLRQGINRKALAVVAAVALAGASLIGALQVFWGNVSLWLMIGILLGVLLSAGYNLEWPGFHGDWQFAAWWAVFPFLVGYLAQGIDFEPMVVAVGMFLFITATVQRILSTRVRYLRRKVRGVGISLEIFHEEAVSGNHWPWVVGTAAWDQKRWMLEPDEKALGWLSAGMVVLAAAGLISRV